MELINLTAPFNRAHIFTERIPLKSDRTAYTGMVYHYRHGSMETTYLDLPGHIAETDDGQNAQNFDLLSCYRQKALLLWITPPADE